MRIDVPLPLFLLVACAKSDPGLGLFVDWAGGGWVALSGAWLWSLGGTVDVFLAWVEGREPW